MLLFRSSLPNTLELKLVFMLKLSFSPKSHTEGINSRLFLQPVINDKRIDSVEGKAFLKALLAIWLGPKPPNEPLKQGILGGWG
jgi:hypothetical protein